MKAHVHHVQINVRDAAVSLPFYKDLLGYLEYRVVHEEPSAAGFSNGTAYGTPREFPGDGPGYYAVFFEDPDRLKLEVAHVPRG